jgi:GntP family gluconate:H+ symporter
VDAGVTDQIVSLAHEFHLSPLLMGWLFAALMRIATGSATVAMTTARRRRAGGHWAGLSTPGIAGAGHRRGLGDLSHVNDGGFWLIKEYFNMTVAQTFKTWTVLETLISVVAFG